MNWQDATETLLKPLNNAQRLGVISDMDGTLSHIVSQPDQAAVTPRNRDLLHALHSQLALVAVVSGRAVIDVQARVGLPELVYVGNHGLERWVDNQVELTPEALQHRPAVEAALRDVREVAIDGMFVEDKGATFSIHYRNTANPLAIGEQYSPVMAEIAQRHGLRYFQGRMVFELRPPIEVDKGSALQALIESYTLDAAVFLGDDTTDVDALKMARKLREQGTCYAIGVGVASADMPSAVQDSADVMVSGVSGVESFLEWLLNAASASSS